MTTNMGYSVLFFIIIYISPVFPSGSIQVTIANYENPSQLDMAGRCCDGVNKDGCPQGQCDISFELCIKNNKTGSPDQTCRSLKPYEDLSKKNLTEKFPFDVFEESYMLFINVSDDDQTERVPVDMFSIRISRNGTARTIVAMGQRTVKPTRIVLHVEHTCDKFFYQDDCSKKCVKADDCTGHYDCDVTSGEKVVHRYSVVSSPWDGLLVCPKINHSIRINVTKDEVNSFPGSIDVTGNVTIGDVTVDVTGHYTFLTKTLALESQSEGSNETIGHIVFIGSMKNETFMGGTVFLNGENCDLHVTRLDGYVDACEGTCVQYGPLRDDYYCCCGGYQQTTPCTEQQSTKLNMETESTYSVYQDFGN